MSVNDEMANQRNSEIANDNYYRLKWMRKAVVEFLAFLDKKRADTPEEAKILVEFYAETLKLRKEVNRDD